MLIVDRDQFILWTTTHREVYYDLKAGCLPFSTQCREAEASLKDGKTVGLMVGGTLVSTIAWDEEHKGFVEHDVAVEDHNRDVSRSHYTTRQA